MITRSLRGQAFERLALLSARSDGVKQDSRLSTDAFTKLYDVSGQHDVQEQEVNGLVNGVQPTTKDVSKVPMSSRELDLLLALCKAAPRIRSVDKASKLVRYLRPYLSESCSQTLTSSPLLRKLEFSPWETLTSSLVHGVLSLGSNFPDLRSEAISAVSAYVQNCLHLISSIDRPQASEPQSHDETDQESRDLSNILVLSTSLLGFLDAVAVNLHLWTKVELHNLILSLENVLCEKFIITAEAAFSIIRASRSHVRLVRNWKLLAKQYATSGRPLSALLLKQSFLQVLEACGTLLLFGPSAVKHQDGLIHLLSTPRKHPAIRGTPEEGFVADIISLASQALADVDENSDYNQIGSTWQQGISNSVKASCLRILLYCSLCDEDGTDQETIMAWLSGILQDPSQMNDEDLAATVLRCLAVLGGRSTTIASTLSRSLPKLIGSRLLTLKVASVAAESLLFILKRLPQDTVITTLYGLGNTLSANRSGEMRANFSIFADDLFEEGKNRDGIVDRAPPAERFSQSDDTLPPIYDNVIQVIIEVTRGYGDAKLTALVLSMLVQKVGKVNVKVDLKIIAEAAILAQSSEPADFRALLRLYGRLNSDAIRQRDEAKKQAVGEAMDRLSRALKGGTELYDVYLKYLLETIISQGDVRSTGTENESMPEAPYAASEISLLIRPFALLVANNVQTPGIGSVESYASLQRDAWYNIVVHGFGLRSDLGRAHLEELRMLAKYTHPLVTEEHADRLESDIDLNIVLRRGKGSRSANELKKEMAEALPQCESQVRSLDYSELVFLKATHLVETLRASLGDCTRTLIYFVDPQLKRSDLGQCVEAIAIATVTSYVNKTIIGEDTRFSAPYCAQQLVAIFEACCHRVERVQNVAYACAEKMITTVTSSLCQRVSLFALLDLLNIMWASCLEEETDEYEWKSEYKSSSGTVSIQLSDDYYLRHRTLRKLHQNARQWVNRAVNVAPLDIKGLLQTYLSDYGDDEALGHMSLGRSFALELGSSIPATDQRLGAIEVESDVKVNTASEFIASYTTRQEYRHTDPLRLPNISLLSELIPTLPHGCYPLSDRLANYTRDEANSIGTSDLLRSLVSLEERLQREDFVSADDLRDPLRRAASLLCRSPSDGGQILTLFVRIPFLSFTKHSIKLGLSLWMGVIKENPRLEPRLLIEIMEGWIMSVRMDQGMFHEDLRHIDPFYLKEEFAPSDLEAITIYQQHVHDLIAPHFRLLQFLTSHFAATRLSSSGVQRCYNRLVKITLQKARCTTSHPLAREVHFHIVLLGLRILRHGTHISRDAHWRLKDDVLSAGLAWFAQDPRWTFGGNRLQVKAETHLLADVEAALQSLQSPPGDPTRGLASLTQKETLLRLLLENEQTRLMVWLFPIDHGKRHHFTGKHHSASSVESSLLGLLGVAWKESRSLTINLATRFPSQAVRSGVRSLLLRYPEMAIDEASALSLLYNENLPDDIAPQLKYLTYWAPVNPISAVTYFFPGYGYHPSIVQYAVRSLESHTVDITFFYVPQIVQALRYDKLGYVERYIIETAKFSQLFAHQIIWNMKANSYQDENSEMPDPMKPTLDTVLERLTSSFSSVDRQFYEREFAFFGEVTGISGTLREYLKKSKQEKKEKIEEELRKIQLDVGVYLPSNPDGEVVGIDRKSGKPLQSHAKTPFMATFRIRKQKTVNTFIREKLHGDVKAPNTYEIWQSAIFKVGDDCRQDILALQLVAAFRGIFQSVGLPVYVFPYSVIATAPGCGVIDVLPNSISRDMLGREAVNGLYDWFVSKFGGEDSPNFQAARANFVKSLAAYSIISFLLQFKDRHNGNIMFDDQGHILHIDFGFCFDIAPGGVAFERAPFKLTKEMVAVLGGSSETQSFRWFEEMCIKAFLASRAHVLALSHIVVCMLDSGLPCFTPKTIQHFKERFVLDKNEREAAEFVRGLVSKSYQSNYTKGYDIFQLATNGIPY